MFAKESLFEYKNSGSQYFTFTETVNWLNTYSETTASLSIDTSISP